ncbi:MAG: SpoIIIAH-like family protein [Bacilli bacterium]|nr:SpoIIIAH-like family protein [Bacilli bacterium]
MINKNGVWFVTLFSLVLVLSIYYITMPTELLITKEKDKVLPTVKVEESDSLLALRVSKNTAIDEEIDSLKKIISNSDATIEDKNNAFERIQQLNKVRSEENTLEDKIKTKYKYNSIVKIDGNDISVTVKSDDNSNEIANNIMRLIQENYEIKKNITVKFQK